MQVLIGGVTGPTGRLLAETLVAAPGISHVIGLDQMALVPPLPGVQFVRVRPRQPEWLPLLREVDAVVHVPGAAAPGTHPVADERQLVADTRFFVEAALAARVPKIIVATSAAVYGPQAETVVSEGSPVRGAETTPYGRDRAQVSDYLDAVTQTRYNQIVKERTRLPAVITRLRMVPLVGPRHTALLRYVRDHSVRVWCHEPDRALQVVHEVDAVSALVLALRQDLPGIFNVSALSSDPGGCTLRDVLSLVGKYDRVCAPWAWIRFRSWLDSRFGCPAAPAWTRLLYLPYTLPADRLRARGWDPAFTPRDALLAAVETLSKAG